MHTNTHPVEGNVWHASISKTHKDQEHPPHPLYSTPPSCRGCFEEQSLNRLNTRRDGSVTLVRIWTHALIGQTAACVFVTLVHGKRNVVTLFSFHKLSTGPGDLSALSCLGKTQRMDSWNLSYRPQQTIRVLICGKCGPAAVDAVSRWRRLPALPPASYCSGPVGIGVRCCVLVGNFVLPAVSWHPPHPDNRATKQSDTYSSLLMRGNLPCRCLPVDVSLFAPARMTNDLCGDASPDIRTF